MRERQKQSSARLNEAQKRIGIAHLEFVITHECRRAILTYSFARIFHRYDIYVTRGGRGVEAHSLIRRAIVEIYSIAKRAFGVKRTKQIPALFRVCIRNTAISPWNISLEAVEAVIASVNESYGCIEASSSRVSR